MDGEDYLPPEKYWIGEQDIEMNTCDMGEDL